MRDPHSRTAEGAPYAMLVVSVCSAVLTALLSSCSADLPVQRESQQADERCAHGAVLNRVRHPR